MFLVETIKIWPLHVLSEIEDPLLETILFSSFQKWTPELVLSWDNDGDNGGDESGGLVVGLGQGVVRDQGCSGGGGAGLGSRG